VDEFSVEAVTFVPRRSAIAALSAAKPDRGSNPRKALVIEDPDVLAACIDQSGTLEFGEHPAYRFELDPKIAANFLARHA
jgi:hypothetical protein